MSPECPTMSHQQEATASSTSNLILGLKEFTKVVESTTHLAASKPQAALAASKPLQESKHVRTVVQNHALMI